MPIRFGSRSGLWDQNDHNEALVKTRTYRNKDLRKATYSKIMVLPKLCNRSYSFTLNLELSLLLNFDGGKI